SIQQAKGRYNRPGGQDFDFQISTSHIVDLLGEIKSELVEDVDDGPSALKAEVDGTLRESDGRKAHRCCSRGAGCSTAQELAPGCAVLFLGRGAFFDPVSHAVCLRSGCNRSIANCSTLVLYSAFFHFAFSFICD